MTQLCAFVAVENVAYHFDILYTYSIADELIEECKVGSWVEVPFGKGSAHRQGIVFDIKPAESNKSIKAVASVLKDIPRADSYILNLAEYLKASTFCTYFEAVKVQLPPAFNYRISVSYCAKKCDDLPKLSKNEQMVYDYMLQSNSFFKKKEVCKQLDLPEDTHILDKLYSKGLVERIYDAAKVVGDLSVKFAALQMPSEEIYRNYPSLTIKQRATIDVLNDLNSCSIKELCYYAGVTSSVVTTLNKKGIVRLFDQPVYRIPTYSSSDKLSGDITLNDEQYRAFCKAKKMLESGGGTLLLYGVTGSGKTSVFLKVIDYVINSGKQVIVMVPEIALTPQMMSIFKGRYGSKAAIFHSALSLGERKDEYRRAQNGEAQIVIGTRSAVFAPFRNIGLIVMDEEQEHSYKSEASPRYSARDVARRRAKMDGALLLLSSATPCVETYARAKSGQYELCTLKKRYGSAVLPDVEIVDMKAERQYGNYTSFSRKLSKLIIDQVADGKQAVVLMNRRGYNTYCSCGQCGQVLMCPNCSVSLTYHSANNRLMCHYCGYSITFKSQCPSCGENAVKNLGTGTQKIEQEIAALFENMRVLRLDSDSVGSRYGFEKSLNEFAEGKYDILLGTQMVAKGLDFENVTVVGVLNADSQLYDDDYLSQEITFDLLTQVVGRSGRGKFKGTAVIQTETPENSVITLAKKQDYEAFFATEIQIRKSMIYPPYCDLCVVMVSSNIRNDAYMAIRSFLQAVSERCQNEYSDLKLMILPPVAPRVERINNRFRQQMLIKCRANKRFRQMISEVIIQTCKIKTFKNISITVDINP